MRFFPHRGLYDLFFSLFPDPPISTDHCDWLYGIFGHETSCTRYWTCWNGTATEQFCVGGLLYNEDTHACDWPQNVVGCQKHREYLSLQWKMTCCTKVNWRFIIFVNLRKEICKDYVKIVSSIIRIYTATRNYERTQQK